MSGTPARFVVRLPEATRGKRLDSALNGLVAGWSRTTLQARIRAGAVRLDGRVVTKPGMPVVEPGEVEIDLAEAVEGRVTEASSAELPVLFADDHLIVVDKPAGMLTHRPAATRGTTGGAGGEASVADLATQRFGPLPTLYGEERPGIVHRLDRDTSGLLLLGRTGAVLEALKRAFQAHEVEKTYLAIVSGTPRFDTEWIDKRLGRTSARRDRISVVGDEEGRDASTYYEVRERFDGFALLAVFPKTGRTHQVRVHLASARLPLLGEEVYVPRGLRNARTGGGEPLIDRHALHAHALSLAHPATGQPLRFESPLPADMAAALERLRVTRRGA